MGRISIAALALCLATGCEAASAPSLLRTELERVRQMGAGSTIDLATVVRADWDTVVVLNPYSSTAEIDSIIGYAWRSDEQDIISSSDSHNLLVFMREGRVRFQALLERDVGDFCCFERNGRYPRDGAVFAAVFEGNWLRLRSVRVPAG